MNKLIEIVKEKQQDCQLNDTEFSKLIGVDRTTWSAIKNGRREPGMKFLKGVVTKYPELKTMMVEGISPTSIDLTQHLPAPTAQPAKPQPLLKQLLTKLTKRLKIG